MDDVKNNFLTIEFVGDVQIVLGKNEISQWKKDLIIVFRKIFGFEPSLVLDLKGMLKKDSKS